MFWDQKVKGQCHR